MAKKKPKKVTTEKKKAIMKKATEYEKRVAQRHRAKQIGGAGKPDYQRGSTKGEVKNRKTPVTKPELINTLTQSYLKQLLSGMLNFLKNQKTQNLILLLIMKELEVVIILKFKVFVVRLK